MGNCCRPSIQSVANSDQLSVFPYTTRQEHEAAQKACRLQLNWPEVPGCVGDLSKLPAKVVSLGNAGIDMLEQTVLELYNNNGVGVALADLPDLRTILTEMGMIDLYSEIGFSGDVASFVRRVKADLLLNPMIVVMAAEWMSLTPAQKLETFPGPSAERNADIRAALAKTAIIDALTMKCLLEPKKKPGDTQGPMFVERMVAAGRKVRDTINWQPYADMFTKAKFKSIEPPIDLFVNRKLGKEANEVDNDEGEDGILRLNVLEAMVWDYLQGLHDNANAGFQVFTHSKDRKRPNLGTDIDREWIRDGVPTGVTLVTCPLPSQWDHLYVVWNMTFVSSYSHAATHWPKLIVPALSYHHTVPGTFLDARVLSLWLQTVHVMAIVSRNRMTSANWSSPSLTALMGRVTLTCSKLYQAEVASIVGHDMGYEAHIACDHAMWAAVQGIIDGQQFVSSGWDALHEKVKKAETEFAKGVHLPHHNEAAATATGPKLPT
jgi:hypothetical protein